MQGGPVAGGAKLARQRALTVVTVATQVAQRDVPAQGQDSREQNGKELGLWLTNRRHLFEDGCDNCHGDGWSPVGFDFHSRSSHRLSCESLSSKSVRTIVR